jgi:hypothetical protein
MYGNRRTAIVGDEERGQELIATDRDDVLIAIWDILPLLSPL